MAGFPSIASCFSSHCLLQGGLLWAFPARLAEYCFNLKAVRKGQTEIYGMHWTLLTPTALLCEPLWLPVCFSFKLLPLHHISFPFFSHSLRFHPPLCPSFPSAFFFLAPFFLVSSSVSFILLSIIPILVSQLVEAVRILLSF